MFEKQSELRKKLRNLELQEDLQPESSDLKGGGSKREGPANLSEFSKLTSNLAGKRRDTQTFRTANDLAIQSSTVDQY